MKKNSIVLFLTLLLVSCGGQPLENRNNLQWVATDTTMLDIDTPSKKKICVGTYISNMPLSSQLVLVSEEEKYLMLDNGWIFVFDWESGTKEDSIPTVNCGTLNNYSGFTFVKEDTLLIYNYKDKVLFLVNQRGVVEEKWTLRRGSDLENGIDVEALNGTRPLCKGKSIVLSGSTFGALNELSVKAQYASEYITANKRLPHPTVSYPAIYYEGNWGGVYMNAVYHSDVSDKIAYSFPVSHEVYLYSCDFSHCDTVFMGSRYAENITESDETPLTLVYDKKARIKYYISQHSYGPILYDTYRKLLYRIAFHPLRKWNVKENFQKPFSIIIADSTGKILSETPILEDYKSLDTGNMHVCREGLAIAEINRHDENRILFRCYKINSTLR